MADYANDVLVEPEWLERHLDDDSIRIVEVDENPALYQEQHIPGAIGLDWRADLQDQVRRDFLGAEDFGRLFGSHGVSDDHLIVLYGDRSNWFAAYTYWYLNLVDVRSPQEYSGELVAPAGYEYEGAQRAGHIPGAHSVPWAQAVKDDGTFKSAEELRELYTPRACSPAIR
jgi:3-mercaptopyruvate sulfurtransferase SseA